jgi:hypothetical protein
MCKMHPRAHSDVGGMEVSWPVQLLVLIPPTSALPTFLPTTACNGTHRHTTQ